MKTNNSDLGRSALDTEPVVEQIFLTPSCTRSKLDLEQQVIYQNVFPETTLSDLFKALTWKGPMHFSHAYLDTLKFEYMYMNLSNSSDH